jgi:hypothetical protein
MTADEYRDELNKLVRKAPRPESIATVQAARAFKDAAKKAQKVGSKSLMQLQTIYNQLRGFY